MLLTILSLILTLPALSQEADLSPFFGYFRVTAYNGVKNDYSRRFFVPSVHTEPSNRVRFGEKEPPLKALKLNFEVPLEQDDGTIHLKHLFVEVPVEKARVEAGPERALILFTGDLEELLSGQWVSCKVKTRAELKRWTEKVYSVEVVKEASLPCASETHQYLLERVIL